MESFDRNLLKLILDNQLISKTDLKKAVNLSKKMRTSLYEALLSEDLISDENLGKLVSDYLKLPFLSLSKVSISKETLNIIPQTIAEKQKTMPFEITEKYLKVATSEPENEDFFKLLAKKVNREVKLYYSTPRDLDEALTLYKKELQRTFDELLKEQVDQAGKAIAKEAPVTKIVDLLVEYSYENKASDIHIEPSENGSLVRFRIDGMLHDVLNLPLKLHEQLVTRIKVLSRLRTDEHLSSQDGKMQIKLPKEELDIRVSIVPIVDGEKVVLRLLSSHFRQFGLTDLGMNEQDLEKVKVGFTKPYGMVLSTGPTGSGKTTSMYAILKIINTREKNIATIEDPVEYDIGGINQIQVNPKTNLTFADGLRAILRQDPDIIYVGEIRDDETADIAINSAMTGHLVLSTLHTNDAATALPRLIDMNIEPFLVSSTVNVIIAQRLVRKICEKCKFSYLASEDELSKQLKSEQIKKHFGESKEIRLFKGKGCPVCHSTGYVGRIGIFEVLVMSESVQELINQKADSNSIAKKAIDEGMSTMLDDGLDKVQTGITTVEEILRATKE